jgi:hypothetical protein
MGFSFDKESYTPIEERVRYSDMKTKYPDRLMVVMNTRVIDGCIYGDVVELLTPEQFKRLDKPMSFAPRFRIWAGSVLEEEKAANMSGVFLST